MRGFRSPPIVGFLALVIGSSFALDAPALAETADPAADASSSSIAPSANADANEEQLIQTRIRELKELLASIDSLRANLTKMAEKALSDADMAPTLIERRRYEQLYAETNARIGELQTTRAEMARLLNELETRLETLRHAQ